MSVYKGSKLPVRISIAISIEIPIIAAAADNENPILILPPNNEKVT
jgi:hypothetical protein